MAGARVWRCESGPEALVPGSVSAAACVRLARRARDGRVFPQRDVLDTAGYLRSPGGNFRVARGDRNLFQGSRLGAPTLIARGTQANSGLWRGFGKSPLNKPASGNIRQAAMATSHAPMSIVFRTKAGRIV